MKSMYIFFCFLLLYNIANATEWGDTNIAPKDSLENDMIQNGFYLNFGLAFPSVTTVGLSSNLGAQPNLEIGNQWYFHKERNWGAGMAISWFQVGYSSNEEFGITQQTLSLHLLKIGGFGTYALNNDMALDFFVMADPTVNANLSDDEASGTYGVAIAFGPKFRYKKFAGGFELSTGNLNYLDSETEDLLGDIKITTSVFRVYAGFKF